MDIIFQSGDFYNQSDWISTYLMPFLGIFIPAIIAVVLFILGIKKERENDKERRKLDLQQERALDLERREKDKKEKVEDYKHKLNGFGNHFKVLLECCIETSRKQIKSLINFEEEFRKDILGRHYPLLNTHEDLNRLLSMDTERLLEYFESVELTGKDFSNTIHQFDYLNVIFEKIPEDINEGNGKISLQYSNDVISLREKLTKRIVEFLGDKKQAGETDDPLFIFLNDIIVNFYKDFDGVPHVKWDYEKLLIPLKNEFLKPEYLGNEFVNQLMEMAHHGANLVFTVKQINERFADDTLLIIKKLDESVEILEEIHKKLAKKSSL